jgi:tripartite-type tricarboxylate transporter receptor subunit TctC
MRSRHRADDNVSLDAPQRGGDYRPHMKRWLLLLLQLLAFAAFAQDWPSRPIRVIVPFAPGGATDVPARLLAPKLQEALGQPIVVENRTGAGGIIGIQAAASSPPDGYTLLVATNAELVMHPYIYAKLPYDPVKDLAPVSIMVESPLVLLTAASSPYNNVADFIAAAKAKPGTVTYSTAGTGSTSHVLTEMMAQQLGISLVHVPYKGGAPASAAIASGEVNIGLLNLGSAIGLIRSGRTKALAITSPSRHADFPALPTIAESGAPGFSDGIWIAMAAPAGVPRAIIDRLSAEIEKALQAPDVRARLAQLGARELGTTPDEAAARIKREAPRVATAIKKANIRSD